MVGTLSFTNCILKLLIYYMANHDKTFVKNKSKYLLYIVYIFFKLNFVYFKGLIATNIEM